MPSVIHPETEMATTKTEMENDDYEIDTNTSCWRDVFKSRDTRKMGNIARCLTLFHNLTIMIALLLTLFQYYEAASISLVASMVALFRVQQEEDENFDHVDLCAAEIQQTNHSSSHQRKKRRKRRTKKRHNSDVNSDMNSDMNSVVNNDQQIAKLISPPQPCIPSPIASAVPEPKEPAIPKAAVLPEDETPTLSKDTTAESGAFRPVDSFLREEDAMTEAFDDEVAKFRARLETIQSTPDRPKVKISAGVFAKQLAAKKNVARSRSGSLVSA